ncbi:MAG: DUF5107 domain-containing protein [Gemmatimonadota bacterium]
MFYPSTSSFARLFVMAVGVSLLVPLAGVAQDAARISVDRRTLPTYPFGEPDPVPILADDARLYPYHRFAGYAHTPVDREWTVVHLQNEWIELWVLPEVGGKVWGARVKESGHEFIYRNEVMKFRNIALRGPWTSGGIEFNFGVIGHTPATATPVDWDTRSNDDGSVSVFVGSMDLPSRTKWRVEVRLPADRAYFETRALWHNPTPLEQPYYNWMTGAAFAQPDLVMTIPGNAYLEHPGGERSWPTNPEGRDLAVYAENDFGGNKSYHVVGEYEDFFGGYYTEDGYGFGHWAPYEEMPGQKLWLWALSRQGGIWEDLLTDTDGQYIEFQAGRLLVQYTPTGETNPISQVGFDPGALDRWTETWFPVEGLGGLSDASRDGAMYVQHDGAQLVVRAHAFGAVSDTVVVTVGGTVVAREPITFEPLEPVTVSTAVERATGAAVDVALPGLDLFWSTDPEAGVLARPFATDEEAWPSIPPQRRRVEAARELLQGRRIEEARALFEEVLASEPWHREALLGLADLAYRRGMYDEGLTYAHRVLQLDAYDPEGNFAAGRLYRGLGHDLDATEAFGWSARSMAYRAVSYAQLADLALRSGDGERAQHYAHRALDYDRHALTAHEVVALAARTSGDHQVWNDALRRLLEIDPLHHFVRVERYLAAAEGEREEPRRALLDGLRGEFPAQELIEVALTLHARGFDADALAVFRVALDEWDDAIARAWVASLAAEPELLDHDVQVAFAAPYRRESIPVLEWAAETSAHWAWTHLLALNLWARDRTEEAGERFAALGARPDQAAAYAARAAFGAAVDVAAMSFDPDEDYRTAARIAPDERPYAVALVDQLVQSFQWEAASREAAAARTRFPRSFELALLQATAWNALGRFRESAELLDAVTVLPSEHSSASQRLFAQAHVALGLDAMDEERFGAATEHFRTATTWPERLGLGRPYDPETRLPDFLQARAARDDGASSAHLTRVVEHSGPALSHERPLDRLDLLAALAYVELGRSEALADFGADSTEGALARIAADIRSAVRDGASVVDAVVEGAEASPSLFTDLDGSMLLRAIQLAR